MSNWNLLNHEEQSAIISAVNKIKEFQYVTEIMEEFDKLDLPLLYNQPGYYNEFCPDTEEYREYIEDYCWDKM